jgi:hypothetical protein
MGASKTRRSARGVKVLMLPIIRVSVRRKQLEEVK